MTRVDVVTMQTGSSLVSYPASPPTSYRDSSTDSRHRRARTSPKKSYVLSRLYDSFTTHAVIVVVVWWLSNSNGGIARSRPTG